MPKGLHLDTDCLRLQILLRMIALFFKLKHVQAKGNRFTQVFHDGGTLESGEKYQAIGFQAVDMSWQKNIVVNVAFTHFSDGTHDAIAGKLDTVFRVQCGFSVDEVAGAMISDVAAVGVAERFNVAKEKCNMHQVDKLISSTTGDLTYSRGGVQQNPFPEGQKLIKGVIECANFFSRTKEDS